MALSDVDPHILLCQNVTLNVFWYPTEVATKYNNNNGINHMYAI